MAHGFKQAKALILRELQLQNTLTKKGMPQPLMVPLLLGPVGGGKSALAREACAHFVEKEIISDMFFATINTGENSDATEVSGVPVPGMIKYFQIHGTASEKEDAKQAYMEWVLNRYAAMACVQPVFLLFDDIDKAPPAIQGALLGVTGNRSFRDRKLHPDTLVMGAGNRTDDDMLAHEISESLRTRMTIIEMVPDVVSFSEFGLRSGEIHPHVIGFLQFKPEYLHKHDAGTVRFPTPRGWWEVSQQFFSYPDPHEDVFGNGSKTNWEGIVARKCSTSVANDFWAWHTIISQINVPQVLLNGVLPTTRDAAEQRMQQYAAVFAVSHELNTKGVKPAYKGLEKLVEDGLSDDMKVAFIVQLSMKTRTAIANQFENTAAAMMAPIVPLKDGTGFKLGVKDKAKK